MVISLFCPNLRYILADISFMPNSKHIPTLELPNMDEFHFREIPWRFSRQHHLFHINRLEGIRNNLRFPLPPHRKTVYDLLFLTQGKSIRSKGLNKYVFKRNDFFFLPALQITAHESMSDDIQGFFLHFSAELFGNDLHLLKAFSFLDFHTNPVVSIPDAEVQPILNILERLHHIYDGKREKGESAIVWYLMALFAEVSRYVDVEKNSNQSSAAHLTQQYKEALTQHIYTCHSVKDFANKLFVSPNHLNKCVKKTLNKTAQTLLNEMLVLEAKSLLKYTELSIAQVAEKLSGSSPSNFARFFKKHTGQSPKEYKGL